MACQASSSRHVLYAVQAREQVADCLAPMQRQQLLSIMFWGVVQQVAPLAKSLEVRRNVVAGVVVQMRRCKDAPGLPRCIVQRGQGAQTQLPATIIAPYLADVVPPPAIPEVMHRLAMRSVA